MDGRNGRLKATTLCELLYILSQGIFILIREKSGNFKRVMCGATMSF